MIVVSDTSSLCNLILVNHLWLLKEIYKTVIIPTVVADELLAADNPAILSILTLDWIQQRNLTDTQIADQLQADRGLDAGEANAIALAIELKADDLLMDERLGRQEAVKLGLPIIGILGVLVVAKQRKMINAVKPVMNHLINQAGFRVSQKLYQRILWLSQEGDSEA